VADNDAERSAHQTVAAFVAPSGLDVTYCVEPEQNIALARNKALEHASGDFVAFIDDDEFPASDWLTRMLEACDRYGVDGVLGPVKPFFDQPPPQWLIRGRFCERPEHPTGSVLAWRQTRTGNVLFRRSILVGLGVPFRREFGNGGEDQDFFRRLMAEGRRFIWCNEAIVHEVVPPSRWNRSYMLRKALLRGQNEKYLLTARNVAKSAVAVPLYTLMLPFLFLAGQHHFMKYLISLLDHAGRLMAAVGLRPLGDKYLAG
jgi:cellulose synthase/poly-beta-1,6-N-acetylglucosamine synthase-like glycosyltransferase